MTRHALTREQVAGSITFAEGVLAVAGHARIRFEAREDALKALLGEMSFDDAVGRAVARAKHAKK